MIIAVKNGLTKKFTPISWELLGENKNGWVEKTEAEVTNKVTKEIPPSGQKTENIVKPKVATKVTDSVEKTEAEVKLPDLEPSDKLKQEFNEIAEKISPNTIKDYFDAVEVKYKANDKLSVLIGLLYENLSGDVELLKSKFSL
jgi:hypothetical protein